MPLNIIITLPLDAGKWQFMSPSNIEKRSDEQENKDVYALILHPHRAIVAAVDDGGV